MRRSLSVIPKILSNSRFIAAVTILIISFVVNLNTLHNEFIYDDKFQILNNQWIKDVRYLPEIFLSHVLAFLGGISTNYYRPIMHVIYMLNYYIFGLKPWGFHLTNVVLHAGISVLVFLIVSMLLDQSGNDITAGILTRRKAKALRYEPISYNQVSAFIAAILFATHPIHTEAVAWIGGIPELSFTFFYLSSFYLYVKTGMGWGRTRILSLIFFFLAAMCKETALTLPILLFVYDYAFNKFPKLRPSSSLFWPLVRRYFPYMIATILYFILRIYAIGDIVPLKKHIELSSYQSLINIFPLFIQYLEKLILPINLNVFHVLHPISSILGGWGLAYLLMTLAFMVLVYLSKQIDRLVFFGLLWVVIPLIPVLYIPALGENAFAERYLYLPSVGFVILFSFIIRKVCQVKILRKAILPAIISLSLILAALYSTGTIKRNYIWRNDYTLWLDTINKSPDASIPHNNLGEAYYGRGYIEKAIDHYRIALDLKPAFPEAHNNIGVAYQTRGWINMAIAHYRRALSISEDFPEAHTNLGVAYHITGQVDKAIKHYQISIKLRPKNPVAYNNLGKAYHDNGLLNEAVEQYQVAIRLRPDFPEARKNLARILKNR